MRIIKAETKYILEESDLENLEFRTSFVCDRLHQMPDRYKPYARTDIYWIGVYCEEQDLGSLSVETNWKGEVYLSANWVKTEYIKEVKALALKWFKTLPEYKKTLAFYKQRNEYTGDFFLPIELDGNLSKDGYASEKETISHVKSNQHHYKGVKRVTQAEYEKLFP